MTRQRYKIIAFIMIFILSSVYLFIFSESGLLERINHNSKKEQLLKKIEYYKDDNIRLQNVYKNYKNTKEFQEDITNSGFINKEEKIIFIKGLNDKKVKKIESKEPGTFLRFEIPQLRIIWLVISALILLLYFSRMPNSNEIKQ